MKTTRKKKNSKMVKKELWDSLKENDDLEKPDLYAMADAITDPIDAFRITKCYEEIIKTPN